MGTRYQGVSLGMLAMKVLSTSGFGQSERHQEGNLPMWFTFVRNEDSLIRYVHQEEQV